ILEYKRVEQKICCYVAGEVSHIENIMARERKEKLTRSLTRSETTQEDTTEKEVENQTDTTTTDRYEMNKEMSKVIEEQRARDISVRAGASASFEPVGPFAELKMFAESDMNFTNSSATTNSFNQSESFAKEVVEK